MKSFRPTRASFPRVNSYCNVTLGRTFFTSSIASSGRPIEVPTSRTINQHNAIPTIPTCPAPTCACRETPTGLDIDHEKPLRGLMPRYTRHLVIHTGQDDWESRIEDGMIGKKSIDSGSGLNLARELRELIGPKGKFYNQNSNCLITNSSFDSWSRYQGRSISFYPEGYTVSDVGETPEMLEGFVQQYLVPPSTAAEGVETSVPEFRVREPDNEPTILICGHNNRDRRCGVMGPLIRDEVLAWIYRQRKQYRQRIERSPEATVSQSDSASTRETQALQRSVSFDFSKKDWEALNCSMKVGLISHIGGHVWAGNMIIYFPNQYRLADGSLSPLAGKGVWYGRVEPRHIEGIMEETVQKGRVIEDLLRGVHGEVDSV